MMTLDDHLEEYKRNGFTIFRGYMPSERVAEWRSALDPEFDRLFPKRPDAPRARIVPLLGHKATRPLARDHITNSVMLDFAERVMGPYVQLDSFEVSGFPIREPDLKNHIDRWHRDAFNVTGMWANYKFTYEQGLRPYTPPLACNCITYLQDMTPETGPLRVVPGSHLDYTEIPKENEFKPHPREQLVSLKAGDMVFTHNELLHSGTWNISNEYRYLLSVYVCRIGLPHRDTFDLPAIREVLDEARNRKDLRILRLFAEDNRFQEREETAWHEMIEEDRRVLKSG